MENLSVKMLFLNIMFTCKIFEQMQRFDPGAGGRGEGVGGAAEPLSLCQNQM